MLRRIKIFIRSLKDSSDGRTGQVKKNALLSLILKAISISIGFILVPLSIAFVGKEQYGIWLTISSIIAWLSLVDVGLGHGLRNNLVDAIAKRKMKLAKIYVSTTYVVLTCLMLVVFLLFFVINPFLDWADILNISPELKNEVTKAVVIVFCYFCLSFLLKIINSIFYAYQRAAYSSIIDIIGQFGSLISIFILGMFVEGSLLYLCVAMCILPTLLILLFNIFNFKTIYRGIIPSIKYFRFWCIRSLIGLSIKFFIIQIAVVIQYQTANLIIARFFDVSEVTSYNIVFKYFSLISVVFGLIATPLWSAATDAYCKDDFNWIRNIVKRYLKLMCFFIIIGFGMLLLSSQVYHLWVGKWVEGDLVIPFALSFWCLIYMILTLPGLIFVNILNGIGAVRLQFILCLLTPLIYIFFCFLLIDYFRLGAYSVFIASILSNVNGIIIAPIQYIKVFVQRKKGIWIAS